MSKRSTNLLLNDILTCAENILEYTDNITFENFANDKKTIDAVLRNFEIIGEASIKLTEDIKEKYSSIDWYRLKGFRNRIAHEYFGIDLTVVWTIKESYLPSLIVKINQLLSEI